MYKRDTNVCEYLYNVTELKGKIINCFATDDLLCLDFVRVHWVDDKFLNSLLGDFVDNYVGLYDKIGYLRFKNVSADVQSALLNSGNGKFLVFLNCLRGN